MSDNALYPTAYSPRPQLTSTRFLPAKCQQTAGPVNCRKIAGNLPEWRNAGTLLASISKPSVLPSRRLGG